MNDIDDRYEEQKKEFVKGPGLLLRLNPPRRPLVRPVDDGKLDDEVKTSNAARLKELRKSMGL